MRNNTQMVTADARNSGVFTIDFDEFNNNIVLPCSHGIVVANLSSPDITGRSTINVISRAGLQESHRFNHVALWSEKPCLTSEFARKSDRRIYTLAWKRNKIYGFTSLDVSSIDYDSRDVCNEKFTPSGQIDQGSELMTDMERIALKNGNPDLKNVCTEGILHTTLGDICIALYPQQCPKTVENFCLLSKAGYYNGNIFHRVIRQFMIQTGDPAGTGAGGQSIWGKDFKDEIVNDLVHDKPYTLSMANAGPNTNGSQFFITVVSCPWLDGKHTIFGRVTKGMDVVHKINNLKTDKHDKPLDEAKIISVSLK